MKNIAKVLIVLLAVTLLLSFASCKGKTPSDIIGGLTGNVDTPTDIKYDGEALTWSTCSGAEYYLVTINGGEEHKVMSPLYIYDAQNQKFSVTVTAANSKKTAVATREFTPLGTVTNLSVTDGKRLTWDSVSYATGYIVSIDNSADGVQVSANYLDLTTTGEHTYRVRAIMQGDDSYYSSYSESKKFTLLEQVDAESIAYSAGYISWKYVTGATSYQVTVNGTPLSVVTSGTKVQYDTQNEDFEVTVTALGDGTSSFDGAKSEIKKFIFLDTVTNIRLVDGILTWDAVDKATGYKIKLNGREQSTVLTETTFDNITEGVTTSVEIMGVSTDASVLSSWSQATSVYLLPAPQLNWNTSYATSESQTQSIYWNWTTTQELSGFNVKVIDPNGNETVTAYPGTQRSYSNDYSIAGDYVISVQAVASATDIYSSRYSKTITVKRLATPERADSNFVVSDATDISKGFTVTFKGNYNATGYYLYRDGNKVDETATNQFSVKGFQDVNSIDSQTFDFKIIAKGSNTVANGLVTIDSLMSDALSFSIRVLAVPQNPAMDGFKYSYTAVTGANGYRINVGTNKFDSSDLTCDISSIEAGSYAVTVCAKGDGEFVLPSNPTPSLTVTRLDAPTNIRIDTSEASEGVLSYNKVLNATGYYIIFNNDGNAIPADSISNINQYIKETGTTVYMQSSANYYNELRTEYYMTSKPGNTINFIKLQAPTFGNVAFTDSELIWNAPTNVDNNVYTPTYQVYLADGTVYNGNKNGTRMDITKLVGGNTYTFTVKAIGDGKTYINSDQSVTVTIKKLKSPTVTIENNAYTWKSVAGAVSYAVYVDGILDSTELHVSGDTYTYTPKKFTEIKTYNVEFYAIGDQGYTTIRSDATTILQETRQLTTPDFTFSYDKASYQSDGKIVATITKESANALGYSYTIAGSTNFSTEKSYAHCPSSAGVYQIRVYAVGGTFDSDGIYYLDSQSQGGNSRYEINLLTSPNPSDMNLSRDGELTWTTIKGAIGYHVIITKDGLALVDTDTTAPTYEIDGFEFGHTYVVEVYAKGNGVNIISSESATKSWTVNA